MATKREKKKCANLASENKVIQQLIKRQHRGGLRVGENTIFTWKTF